MRYSDQIATRYLLGELSESEQVAIEKEYFSSVEIFDEITKVETELVDDYVRGRLSPQARERFEQFYLAHPERRERVKFAEALAIRLDQLGEQRVASTEPVSESMSWWRKLLSLSPGSRLAPGLALASLLLVIIGAWLFIESRRARNELAETQAALANQEQREREMQQLITDERARADQLAAEVERLRNQSASPSTGPSTESSTPAFVSFLITVGSTRGVDSGAQDRLVIPKGAAEVRLQVNLKEHDYPAYIAVLQEVGGKVIFTRQDIKPRTSRSGAFFTLSLPAGSFNTGDYILTLKAANDQGEVEDLSKSIFRVEKK